MATIKTAISIDEGVYNEIERMTKHLHISRSQFFSQAARYMIDQKENLELLQKINAAYATPEESVEDKRQRKQEKRYRAARMAEQWK
jgi:metal-responsive CopG/Arc/MetJ family transcriptional regulator